MCDFQTAAHPDVMSVVGDEGRAAPLLLTSWVRRREPKVTHHSNLLRETGDGFRMVFSNAPMRSLALLVFGVMLFTATPEGLAAAWVREAGGPAHGNAGLWQVLIMMAQPVGGAVGALLLTRMLNPTRRRTLLLPFAMAVPAMLIPSLLQPGLPAVAVMAMLAGIAATGVLPTSNALFVRVVPDGYRARAFGVMAMGVQLMQGVGIFVAGMLAERMPLPVAVGVWSVVGLLVMVCIAVTWPSRASFDDALTTATPPQQPTGTGTGSGATAQPVSA